MPCIILVGGIPAAGKTAFCKYIVDNCDALYSKWESIPLQGIGIDVSKYQLNKEPRPNVYVLPFDDLCSLEDQAKIVQTLSGWKNFRVQIIEAAERYICEVCRIECPLQGPLTQRCEELLQKMRSLNRYLRYDELNKKNALFLIEDNFYYRSMRYAWYQMARRGHFSFCHIQLECPIEIAIERNCQRYNKIPENLIKSMTKNIECPEPKKNKWERFSIILDTTCDWENQNLLSIIDLVEDSKQYPVRGENENRAEDQAICSKNVVHQCDKMLRTVTGSVIRSIKRVKKETPTHVVSNILKIRHEVLSEIKCGAIALPQNIVDAIEDGTLENSKEYFMLADLLSAQLASKKEFLKTV